VKSKFNSVKRFEFGIKFGIEWCIKYSYLVKNFGKKNWSNWAKLGKKWSNARKIFTA